MSEQDLEAFEAIRPRLGAIAYRLLGSASEAEDVVQETFLRWDAAHRRAIGNPPAWLTRVLTNLCLTQLSSARARRETYVGQWLPEPLLDDDPMLGPAETLEQREAVSLAVLGMLETLPPQERAVLVLREAFTYSHARIAEILETTEAGRQQALARARRRLEAAREEGRWAGEDQPREGWVGRRQPVDPDRSLAVTQAFLEAAVGGDLHRLLELLDEGVTSRADGGGALPAARRPVFGSRSVAAYLRGIFRPTAEKARVTGGPVDLHLVEVNRDPALLITVDGHPLGVIALVLDGELIREVRIQLAPAKLARLREEWARRTPTPPLTRLW
ncbi:sigma-70 family RNA polymerase sigma factor [Brachybacterium sp. ACRRE]|uniref:sigma-70 family RNA polymerase sigma factor n=1 Tax=Brachybacterium sp. ACRRE TaxID=2918184 RepID=UPI001EF2978F|nr:sigma-70 family RNA polymerase sigma factor [Brachybacterium sp. ACRRE]MCG7310321.1 sigma-70 family RNA polymerase sigma factor [Brachybacterium sp. ACRRE]